MNLLWIPKDSPPWRKLKQCPQNLTYTQKAFCICHEHLQACVAWQIFVFTVCTRRSSWLISQLNIRFYNSETGLWCQKPLHDRDKCVVHGFKYRDNQCTESVYWIRFNRVARCFRNEGMDTQHLQEFTQVEWYASYWNFEDNIKFYQKFIKNFTFL